MHQKHQFREQLYAIVGQTASTTKADDTPMSIITLWGIEDAKTYHTYVVSDYKNSAAWSYITAHPDLGFIVKFAAGRLKTDSQINADSMPLIQDQLATTLELKQVCHQLWAEANIKTTKKVKPTQDEILAQFAIMEVMIKGIFE